MKLGFLIFLFYLFPQVLQASFRIKMYCPRQNDNASNCVRIVHVLSEEAAREKETQGCQREPGTGGAPSKPTAPKSRVKSGT